MLYIFDDNGNTLFNQLKLMGTVETFIISVISAFLVGLVLFFIQVQFQKKSEQKAKLGKNKLGKIEEKYIDKDFLYNYEPGKLSIEKVIEDFGQPNEKVESFDDFELDEKERRDLILYTYKFTNAVIIFSTYKNESSVISITVNADYLKKHPVKCRFSFAEDDEYFGKAKITQEIIKEKVNFKREMFINWAYSAIQSRYFYRELKHLTFTYVVCNSDMETENDMLDRQIDQLCISVVQNVCPIIYFYDMI